MPSGDALATLSLATTDTWKDKSGEKQERTEWHRVSIFGRLAEIAGEYLKKGSQVYIEGRIQTRKYTDKDGTDKYSTEIVASEMKMLGGRGGAGMSGGTADMDRSPRRTRFDRVKKAVRIRNISEVFPSPVQPAWQIHSCPSYS